MMIPFFAILVAACLLLGLAGILSRPAHLLIPERKRYALGAALLAGGVLWLGLQSAAFGSSEGALWQKGALPPVMGFLGFSGFLLASRVHLLFLDRVYGPAQERILSLNSAFGLAFLAKSNCMSLVTPFRLIEERRKKQRR